MIHQNPGTPPSMPGRSSAKEVRRLFAELYRHCVELAQRLLAHEPRRRAMEAHDLVHESFLRLSRERTPPATAGSFLVAIRTIMRRVLMDHARARRRQKRASGATVPLSESVAADDRGSAAHPEESLDAVMAVLADLPSRAAAVVIFRYYHDVPDTEIARRFQVSVSTVRRDASCALRRLRRELDPPE